MQTIEQYVASFKNRALDNGACERIILNIARLKYPHLLTQNVDIQYKAIREAGKLYDDHLWYMTNLDIINKTF